MASIEQAEIPILDDEGQRQVAAMQRVGKLSLETFTSALDELVDLPGYVASAFVDANSGLTVASHTSDPSFDIEHVAAVEAMVMMSKRIAMNMLGADDTQADLFVTIGEHCHAMRPVPDHPELFIFAVSHRSEASAELTRMRLQQVVEPIVVG